MVTKRRPISGNQILVGFLLISILLFSLIGAWMLEQTREIELAIETSNQQAAKDEIQNAVSNTLSHINEQIIKLKSWSEIQQQFNNPVFYDYWQRNRPQKIGIVHDHIKNIELYSPDGSTLRQSKAENNALPNRLPTKLTYLSRNKDKLYYYNFTEFTDPQANKKYGYIGARVDFIETFLDINRFRYIDTKSLKFEIPDTTYSTVEQLIPNIKYNVVTINALHDLKGVMFTSFFNIIAVLIILGISAYYILYRFFQNPLQILSSYINNFRRNQNKSATTDITLDQLVTKEIDALFNSFKNYQNDLNAMHSNLNKKNTELWRLAHHDPLTSVPNRRAYDEDWKQMTSLIQGQLINISVMLFDCDHFKAINDTYGHATGDSVIKAVASCIQSCLRDNDRLYRLGGDEFAIHVINATPDEIDELAICCQNSVNNFSFKELGIKEPVRFSIGIAHASGSETKSLHELHKKADIAMYQAKKPGTGKIVHYEPELSTSPIISSRYLQAVYEAIENCKGISLHYQPVISLTSPDESFCEVLARLEDDEGLIMPSHIFPIVNAEGLEVEFDLAILKAIKSSLETGAIPKKTRLSINLGGTSVTNPLIYNAIKELHPYLNNYGIILEVTETALITELHKATEILTELRAEGFLIALDDFGSGYSSLRYLASMPVDIIKFDILMVHALESNDTQRQIAIDVARMILSAGYDLVAEGIEDEAMLRKIHMLGFTHAQGYLLAYPSTEIHQPEKYNIHQRSNTA
ncbi:MAG: bifunctional diguanylate cyclase/phosphodiesterase [Gammaproteobacteria bacterium]|nr:bifunctional diguanylate cyclase/phosphodiesterase [Gammaproteobacteria bacterium]MCW9006126.1 bifunctional diguanylate cyclase/phosphodiesterase [Gammaproteobacteria bacterium]